MISCFTAAASHYQRAHKQSTSGPYVSNCINIRFGCLNTGYGNTNTIQGWSSPCRNRGFAFVSLAQQLTSKHQLPWWCRWKQTGETHIFLDLFLSFIVILNDACFHCWRVQKHQQDSPSKAGLAGLKELRVRHYKERLYTPCFLMAASRGATFTGWSVIHRSHSCSSWLRSSLYFLIQRKHQAPSDFRRWWRRTNTLLWRWRLRPFACHSEQYPLTWLKHAGCLATVGPAEVPGRAAFGEDCAIRVGLFKIYRLTLFYPCSSDQTLNWNRCHGN